MSRYLLTVDAEQDIDVIKDYLLLQGGTGLARHVLGRIQSGMELIGDLDLISFFFILISARHGGNVFINESLTFADKFIANNFF